MKYSTRQRIGHLLVNTKDHEIARREITMRLRYLKDFQSTYQYMLEQGMISEHGTGKKGDTIVVRLLMPSRATSEHEEEYAIHKG